MFPSYEDDRGWADAVAREWDRGGSNSKLLGNTLTDLLVSVIRTSRTKEREVIQGFISDMIIEIPRSTEGGNDYDKGEMGALQDVSEMLDKRCVQQKNEDLEIHNLESGR